MTIYDAIPDTNKLVLHMWAEFGYKDAIGDAFLWGYRAFNGCFLDHEDSPKWARDIAQYEKKRFLDQAPFPKFSEHGASLASNPGKGKRAVFFNYAMKLDQRAFTGMQDYGNCTFASMGWNIMTHVMAVQILGLKEQERWLARHGTVWYCTRGHCGQGSTLSAAAHAVTTLGVQTMRPYDGWDFSDENYDEQCGNSWCRGGPPDELVKQTQTNLHKTVSLLDEQTPEAWMDVMYNGGCVHTGSTTTAAKDGDPISSFTGVGPHAQAAIGYDDTEEFRDWYRETTGRKISYPVVIFCQTWGPVKYLKNWPTHLWGRQPEGAFVLPLPGAVDRMGRDAYAYMPNTDGYQVNNFEWDGTP